MSLLNLILVLISIPLFLFLVGKTFSKRKQYLERRITIITDRLESEFNRFFMLSLASFILMFIPYIQFITAIISFLGFIYFTFIYVSGRILGKSHKDIVDRLMN